MGRSPLPAMTPVHLTTSAWCRKELAHGLMHGQPGSRPLEELEAESAAFIVCRQLGIDSGDYSFGYVTTWAGGGEQAVTAIKRCCGRIRKTASTLIALVEKLDEEPSRRGRTPSELEHTELQTGGI